MCTPMLGMNATSRHNFKHDSQVQGSFWGSWPFTSLQAEKAGKQESRMTRRSEQKAVKLHPFRGFGKLHGKKWMEGRAGQETEKH